MARGMAMVFVAIVTGILVFFLISPRLLSPQTSPPPKRGAEPPRENRATEPPRNVAPPASSSPASTSPAPIETPLADKERATATREMQRAPYYNRLLVDYRDQLRDVHANAEDGAMLELYAAFAGPDLSNYLIQNAVLPQAQQNGFRVARVYFPNPPGSLERDHLDAEAVLGSDGNWRIFKK